MKKEEAFLFKIENNETSNKLRYYFCISNGNDWKEKYKINCKIMKKEILEQNDLSDYDFFLKINPYIDNDENMSRYFLIVDGEPATQIVLTKDNDDIVDITLSTSNKFKRKGCATIGIELVEEMLFEDPSIKGTKLIDLFSTGGATTKIAEKLGYKKQEDEIIFIKENPNFNKKNTKK